MTAIRRRLFAAASLCLAVFVAALPAVAAGPHRHGVATLDVVVDGERLLVALETPLDNLVGFEHAPKNDRQRAALADARAALADGTKLLRASPEAGCAQHAAKVELPYGADAPADAHRHDKGAPDKNAHDKHGHAEDAHSEASVEWEFSCANPAALIGLDIGLFDAFRRLQTLRVQTATPRGQGAATLTSKRRTLAL